MGKNKIKEEKEDIICECGNEECSCDKVSNEDINEIIHEDKVQELEEKLVRLQAEFQNYRRRSEDEVLKLFKYSNQDIILGILPVIDNFERALDMDISTVTDEVSKFLEGFKMIERQLKEVLQSFEVTEIDALNKEFDTDYHQAVLTEKIKGLKPGIVVDVLQKGYMLKDKVIRHSMVKVSE